jgi:hypothetical protein
MATPEWLTFKKYFLGLLPSVVWVAIWIVISLLSFGVTSFVFIG